MIRRALAVVMAAGALFSAGISSAAPGQGGDKEQPIGAAARAKYGIDPLAVPPADIGSAEDPAPIGQPVPPAAPVITPLSRTPAAPGK